MAPAQGKKPRRPNRSAASRRQQYHRAQARCVQTLLKAMDSIHHRGCKRTHLGESLVQALRQGGPCPVPHRASVGVQAGSDTEPLNGPVNDTCREVQDVAERKLLVESIDDMARIMSKEMKALNMAVDKLQKQVSAIAAMDAVAETAIDADRFAAKVEPEKPATVSSEEVDKEADLKNPAQKAIDEVATEKAAEKAIDEVATEKAESSESSEPRGQRVARLCKTFESRTT